MACFTSPERRFRNLARHNDMDHILKYLDPQTKTAIDGINIDSVSFGGSTALMQACMQGHERMASLLLDYGADIELQGKLGWSPIMCASYVGKDHVIQVLLRRGAKINAMGKDGWTCLFHAAFNGHISTIQLLLEHGANPNHKADTGQTAFQWATFRNHKDCAQALEEAMRIQDIMEGTLSPKPKQVSHPLPSDQELREGMEKWLKAYENYTQSLGVQQLSVEDAAILACELTGKDVESGQTLMTQLDRNKDGMINRMEFLLAYENFHF